MSDTDILFYLSIQISFGISILFATITDTNGLGFCLICSQGYKSIMILALAFVFRANDNYFMCNYDETRQNNFQKLWHYVINGLDTTPYINSFIQSSFTHKDRRHKEWTMLITKRKKKKNNIEKSLLIRYFL